MRILAKINDYVKRLKGPRRDATMRVCELKMRCMGFKPIMRNNTPSKAF